MSGPPQRPGGGYEGGYGEKGYKATEEAQDDRLEYWMPAKDIVLEVLASDLPLYLGRDATVKPSDHKDGRPGYLIKSYIPVTIPMMQDLKADSAKWADERERSRVHAYTSSRTHSTREYNGPTEPPPDPQRRITDTARTKPVPIPQVSQERYGDPYPMSSSQSNRAPMGRHNPSPAQKPGYTTPSSQSDPYGRYRQEETFDNERSNPVFNDRQGVSESYAQPPPVNRNAPTSQDQAGAQRMFTREEVEKLVAKELKKAGKQEEVEKLVARELKKAGKQEVSTAYFRQIVDQHLERLVDQRIQAMQREQQTQQQTQSRNTRESGNPRPPAQQTPSDPMDPPDKPPQPSHPGSYGHKPDPYSRHKSKK